MSAPVTLNPVLVAKHGMAKTAGSAGATSPATHPKAAPTRITAPVSAGKAAPTAPKVVGATATTQKVGIASTATKVAGTTPATANAGAPGIQKAGALAIASKAGAARTEIAPSKPSLFDEFDMADAVHAASVQTATDATPATDTVKDASSTTTTTTSVPAVFRPAFRPLFLYNDQKYRTSDVNGEWSPETRALLANLMRFRISDRDIVTLIQISSAEVHAFRNEDVEKWKAAQASKGKLPTNPTELTKAIEHYIAGKYPTSTGDESISTEDEKARKQMQASITMKQIDIFLDQWTTEFISMKSAGMMLRAIKKFVNPMVSKRIVRVTETLKRLYGFQFSPALLVSNRKKPWLVTNINGTFARKDLKDHAYLRKWWMATEDSTNKPTHLPIYIDYKEYLVDTNPDVATSPPQVLGDHDMRLPLRKGHPDEILAEDVSTRVVQLGYLLNYKMLVTEAPSIVFVMARRLCWPNASAVGGYDSTIKVGFVLIDKSFRLCNHIELIALNRYAEPVVGHDGLWKDAIRPTSGDEDFVFEDAIAANARVNPETVLQSKRVRTHVLNAMKRINAAAASPKSEESLVRYLDPAFDMSSTIQWDTSSGPVPRSDVQRTLDDLGISKCSGKESVFQIVKKRDLNTGNLLPGTAPIKPADVVAGERIADVDEEEKKGEDAEANDPNGSAPMELGYDDEDEDAKKSNVPASTVPVRTISPKAPPPKTSAATNTVAPKAPVGAAGSKTVATKSTVVSSPATAAAPKPASVATATKQASIVKTAAVSTVSNPAAAGKPTTQATTKSNAPAVPKPTVKPAAPAPAAAKPATAAKAAAAPAAVPTVAKPSAPTATKAAVSTAAKAAVPTATKAVVSTAAKASPPAAAKPSVPSAVKPTASSAVKAASPATAKPAAPDAAKPAVLTAAKPSAPTAAKAATPSVPSTVKPTASSAVKVASPATAKPAAPTAAKLAAPTVAKTASGTATKPPAAAPKPKTTVTAAQKPAVQAPQPSTPPSD